jgi:hypothetical protein
MFLGVAMGGGRESGSLVATERLPTTSELHPLGVMLVSNGWSRSTVAGAAVSEIHQWWTATTKRASRRNPTSQQVPPSVDCEVAFFMRPKWKTVGTRALKPSRKGPIGPQGTEGLPLAKIVCVPALAGALVPLRGEPGYGTVGAGPVVSWPS